jgi:polyisoprenoid-binding protein YceI
MHALVRIAGPIVAAVLLTGCPSTSVRSPGPSREALPDVGAPEVREATVYAIDSQASSVQIHVFRGGTLARLGHNHVMTSKHVTGRAWVQPALERSGFELSFPVAQLLVDDAQERAAAGSDFPGEIPDGDREGTRKNMLRAEVLDAERYPTISLRSVKLSGTQQNPQVIARIKIKEASQDVTIPTSVTIEAGRLTATGEFDIQQTSFGIKPFSIGLGALEVVDKLHVKFTLIAEKS